MDIIFNGIGISGVICILVAYFMLQKGTVRSDQLIYPSLNLVGSLLIMVSIFHDWNLPSFFIEICWTLISLYGIWGILKKKKV